MKGYSSVIWDFDGVILNSNEIRNMGFVNVLKDYPKAEVDKLMDYHIQNGGLSRYHKLGYFFEVIRGEQPNQEKVYQYADKFKQIMLSNLCDPDLLIRDSLDFIIANHQDYQYHIASGSDNNELNEICERLNIAHYFISINGSPTPKIEIVDRIIESQNYDRKEYSLIGDSINDYEAAAKNQIHFYAYNSDSLRNDHEYIESFSPLTVKS